MDRNKLNLALKDKKLITDAKLNQLDQAKTEAKQIGSWEDFLIDKKAVSENDLLQVKSEMLNVPVEDLTKEQIPLDILNLVPEPIAHRHQVISFAKTKEELSLAMVDPEDIQT